MTNNLLFKAIDVWRRTDRNSAVRYRCFEILGKNEFCVQSSDYFNLPLDREIVKQLDEQHITLFIEESPNSREKIYSSLEEAIMMHEKEFNELE